MKIVERVGNFVIKETNNSERSYKSYMYEGRQNMDNYYIYLDTKTAKKYEEDDYISCVNTIEEAREIVSLEQIKYDFNLLGFAKKLHKTIKTLDKLTEVLDFTNVSYSITKHEDSLYNNTIIYVNFHVSDYVENHTIILSLIPLDNAQYFIKTLGVI